jgi:translation initiation factor IF-1
MEPVKAVSRHVIVTSKLSIESISQTKLDIGFVTGYCLAKITAMGRLAMVRVWVLLGDKVTLRVVASRLSAILTPLISTRKRLSLSCEV